MGCFYRYHPRKGLPFKRFLRWGFISRAACLYSKVLCGKLLNLSGVPGFIRECDYRATVTNTRIKVRINDLFTIINVDGLDIYFKRRSGKISGVGISTCREGARGTSTVQ